MKPVVLTRRPAEPHPLAPEVPAVGFDAASPRAIVRAILRWLAEQPGHEIILQYTSQMFGASRFGSWAVQHLVGALRARGSPVNILLHELYLPWSARPDLLLGAVAQRMQLAVCARRATRLVVTTKARLSLVSRWFQALPGSPAVRLTPIGSPVAPVPWSPSRRGFRVGTFSTLAAGKRFDVVLDAFARIAREVPDAELWLLGDMLGRQDRRTRHFVRAVAAHPARDRIHMPGKQPLVIVAEIVASFHAFLFVMESGATTRSSTLPLALGSGVPVIATRGPETDDVFQDGHNLLFAPSLSGEAFADSVLRLREEPDLAAKVSQGALALHDRCLSWPRIVDCLLDSSGTAWWDRSP
jgi:glycosyltransferase involved in cell wall biosynthesis